MKYKVTKDNPDSPEHISSVSTLLETNEICLIYIDLHTKYLPSNSEGINNGIIEIGFGSNVLEIYDCPIDCPKIAVSQTSRYSCWITLYSRQLYDNYYVKTVGDEELYE